MSKHTPTPWLYVPGPGGGTIEDAHGAQIAVVSGQAPLRGNPEIPIEEIQGANGRLMALAPEMEEALRAIKDHEQQPNGDACVLHIAQAILWKVDRARAAIEKAEGKS